MLGPLLRSGTKAGGAASPLPLGAFGGEGRLGNGTHSLRGRGQRDEGTCQVPAGRRGPHPPPPTRAPGPQAVGLQCCFQHQEHASLRFLPRPLNYKSRTGWPCPERRLLLKRAPGVARPRPPAPAPGLPSRPRLCPCCPGRARRGPGAGRLGKTLATSPDSIQGHAKDGVTSLLREEGSHSPQRNELGGQAAGGGRPHRLLPRAWPRSSLPCRTGEAGRTCPSQPPGRTPSHMLRAATVTELPALTHLSLTSNLPPPPPQPSSSVGTRAPVPPGPSLLAALRPARWQARWPVRPPFLQSLSGTQGCAPSDGEVRLQCSQGRWQGPGGGGGSSPCDKRPGWHREQQRRPGPELGGTRPTSGRRSLQCPVQQPPSSGPGQTPARQAECSLAWPGPGPRGADPTPSGT